MKDNEPLRKVWFVVLYSNVRVSYCLGVDIFFLMYEIVILTLKVHKKINV